MEDKTFETPPSPSNLITSLCSIGYDLNSAVADILDNSIAAGAKNIYVDFALHESKEVFLKIEDDGCGMKRLELLRAMRFGSFDPRQTRKISDLGQFGLGLKTASLSQSDRLVVRSKSDQEASCFEWNLDLVRKKDRWELIEHSNCLPEMRFRSEEQSLKSGTLVYWPEVKALRGKDKESFNASFMSLRRHLRLIFHRFLEDGDTNIWFQGQRLEPLNPFNPDSMALIRRSPKIAWPPIPEQPKVTAETFLLSPEMLKVDSSLTEEEIYNMQGVYIYRSKRLISYGGWLGLKNMPKSKETSLIRTKIDFTGEVNGGWRLDIRKKNAIPPIEVKKWIEPYLRAAREEAEELYDTSRSVSGKTSGIWVKQRGKAETLDFSQPFLIIFMELCSKGVSKEVTEGFLDLIARCSPSNLKRARKELSENELLALHSAVEKIKKEERFQEEAVNILKLPPFNLYPYEVKQILKEIEQ